MLYRFTGAVPTVFPQIPFDHTGDAELRSLAINPGDVVELPAGYAHPDLQPLDAEYGAAVAEHLHKITPPATVALADVVWAMEAMTTSPSGGPT